MAGFEKFKNALKKAEEERHEELQQDIRKVRNVIEKVLFHGNGKHSQCSKNTL